MVGSINSGSDFLRDEGIVIAKIVGIPFVAKH